MNFPFPISSFMSSFRNRDRLRQEARFISLYPSLNYKYNYSLLYKTGLSLEMYRFNPVIDPRGLTTPAN